MWPYPGARWQQFGKPLQGGGGTATDNDYLVEQVVEGTKVEPRRAPWEM